jgi:hypothetical protein
MQAEYRSRARSNVMTLTRARARLAGNQIGVCSPRATSVARDEVRILKRRWRAVEGDVYEPTEPVGLPVDEPHLIYQPGNFILFLPVRLGGAPWRRDFNFGLMIIRSRRQSGPRGCAARSERMTLNDI